MRERSGGWGLAPGPAAVAAVRLDAGDETGDAGDEGEGGGGKCHPTAGRAGDNAGDAGQGGNDADQEGALTRPLDPLLVPLGGLLGRLEEDLGLGLGLFDLLGLLPARQAGGEVGGGLLRRRLACRRRSSGDDAGLSGVADAARNPRRKPAEVIVRLRGEPRSLTGFVDECDGDLRPRVPLTPSGFEPGEHLRRGARLNGLGGRHWVKGWDENRRPPNDWRGRRPRPRLAGGRWCGGHR